MKFIKLPKEIMICEVGPRDGLQNEKKIISTKKKVELINQLSETGFKVIEVGSFVHPKAVPQMADTDEVARLINRKPGVEYRALVTNRRGVERAVKAGVKKVKFTISASESHNRSNFNRSVKETMAGFQEMVELALVNNIDSSGAISTAFGCPFEGVISVKKIKEIVEYFLKLGIFEISLSDTTGVANPKQVFDICSEMVKGFPEVRWILHFHNTRGMALANILAGMQAGITCYDGAFAGLGGCPFAPGASGNVATEDIVHMLHEMGINTGIDLEQAMATARIVQNMFEREIESFVLKAGRCQDLVKEKVQYQNNN